MVVENRPRVFDVLGFVPIEREPNPGGVALNGDAALSQVIAEESGEIGCELQGSRAIRDGLFLGPSSKQVCFGVKLISSSISRKRSRRREFFRMLSRMVHPKCDFSVRLEITTTRDALIRTHTRFTLFCWDDIQEVNTRVVARITQIRDQRKYIAGFHDLAQKPSRLHLPVRPASGAPM